jgi:hypothetical protein
MTATQAGSVLIEVGAGELIDKLTILEIKLARMSDAAKLRNVAHEKAVLDAARAAGIRESAELARLEAALLKVNEALWEIEDAVRECEQTGEFGAHFIALARSVYQRNDERAALKKAINQVCGSTIIEEKSYAELPATPDAG